LREATDLAISAGIRRELSGRRIDLSKIKFPVKAGVVSLQGELCFVGLEKSTDETAVELKFIESSLKKLPGVKELIFEFTNWNKNDTGIWEPSGGAATPSGATPRVSPDGEGLVCPDCDYVIRFCPCCGKPLAGAGKAHTSRFRKPVPPVKPIVRKKRPGSPLLSPVVKPVISDTPVITSPELIKNIPASVPAARVPATPTARPEPPRPPTPGAEPGAIPTIAKPTTTAQPPFSAPKPAPPKEPITGQPAPVAAPVMPSRPAAPATTQPEQLQPTVAKPAMPTAPLPPAAPAKPAQKQQPEVFPGTPDEDIPDFGSLSLKDDSLNVEETPAADDGLNSLLSGLTMDLPEPLKTSPAPKPPQTPAPAPAPAPVKPTTPAKPADPVADFNFDSLLSAVESEEAPAQNNTPATTGAFEAPTFDLGSLGDLDSTPADSATPGDNLCSFEPPADDDDTPLPPQKKIPAPAKPIETFEDDDTPLPPMKPQTPAPARDAKGKDLFASLFSDADINLGLPAEDSSGQGKNPFGNLDLELDILEVFPGNEEPAPAPSPVPAKGKKPPAPAQPAPADDNPFNLDNIIDLDSPVEEKSPSKKKGSDDPFNLDDFDISKFKL